MSTFRILRHCFLATTLAILFLYCCVLELAYGSARVVCGLPAEVQLSCASAGNVTVQQLPSSSLAATLHIVHLEFVLCSMMRTLIYIQWVTFLCK